MKLNAMNLALVALVPLVPLVASANLPDAQETTVKLQGNEYRPLISALQNYYEVPAADRDGAKASPAADRALSQVRTALQKLDRAPGLPIDKTMDAAALANGLKRMRVAGMFSCGAPGVIVMVQSFKVGVATKYYHYPSRADVPTNLESLNPDCALTYIYPMDGMFHKNPTVAY